MKIKETYRGLKNNFDVKFFTTLRTLVLEDGGVPNTFNDKHQPRTKQTRLINYTLKKQYPPVTSETID